MFENLIFFLIASPLAAAAACMVFRCSTARAAVVAVTAFALTGGALLLVWQGPGQCLPVFAASQSFTELVRFIDFSILGLILYFGIRHRNPAISLAALAQAGLLAYFEFAILNNGHSHPMGLYADHLSLIMICLICIAGSLIIIFALPYMASHEAHLKPPKTRQPRFFALIFLFIGAMNALVTVNDLMLFYLFFEITTLCSFLLIGHDASPIAKKNAATALWMNSLGGLALLMGIVLIYNSLNTLDIQTVIRNARGGAALTIPLSLLCLAGFTKAAQMPFQKWLLGAMVAPTPTSALLHSSTMVKAGIFLVLRFAPAYEGTVLSFCIAVCGAFTFLSAAALAVGQRNAKKVLAYSTISNLGLILACAGINTHTALTAAVLLTIFHAVSKALLFLCVGTIEQHIKSRDIEDMRGLFASMPQTAMIITLGILTMILPPFGMLLGKWMAIQSAAGSLFTLLMLAMGSALTVVYWARWAGILMGSEVKTGHTPERLLPAQRMPLMVLLAAAVALSMAAPFIYSGMIRTGFSGTDAFATTHGVMAYSGGSFAVIPLFLTAMGVFVFALMQTGSEKKNSTTPGPYPHGAAVYMSGISGGENGTFVGPMNRITESIHTNYYLSAFFGEKQLSLIANAAAILLIAVMMGGALVS